MDDRMEARIRQTLTDLLGPKLARTATLECLGGHASLRIYWRVGLPQGSLAARPQDTTLMAMVMPLGEDALKSEEGGAAQVPTELPFQNVQRHLKAAGLRVPHIDVVCMERGVVLLEDLGQTHFEDLYLALLTRPIHTQRRATRALYNRAIDLLVDAQLNLQDRQQLPETIAHERSFDPELLRWELDHYLEWGLQAQYGANHVAPFEADIAQAFEHIVEALSDVPQCMVFRDYQSRNIMSKRGDLVLIDFQDALMGPCIYDLVALLRDSYITLEDDLVEELVGDYVLAGQRAGLAWCADEANVRRWFALQTIQRKLKDAGRFIYIDRVKDNPSFLHYYEPSLKYVHHAIAQLPELQGLGDVLGKLEPQWPTRSGATESSARRASTRA